MILAQYTIRSKQEYIFKTNRVLEIIGASEIIAGIWDDLFAAADATGLKYERADKEFDMNKARSEFEEGNLNFVELFCGGGNETLLFDAEVTGSENGEQEISESSSFFRLNRAFSYKLLTEYPGIIPMVVYVETTGDYSADYKRLMEASDRKKNTMEPQWDMFTVPFAMMDRDTFQPYSSVINIDGNKKRLSDESISKNKVGRRIREESNDVKLFDDMVTKKEKESLLAVVHADGNNMGKKIMGLLHGEKDYGSAVKQMRVFTSTTADCFEKEGSKALKDCQDRLKKENQKLIGSGKLRESSLAFRRIIGSGDDLTFICNARFVMDYVQAYLESVQEYQRKHNTDWGYSACAGICIFHSHYPFSRAYSIAEQACDDGAKEKVHLSDENGRPVELEQGWMDFHFIHSGIGGNLEELRRSQGVINCIARPWLVTYDSNDENAKKAAYKYSDLVKLKKIFEKKRNDKGEEDAAKGVVVSRTSIKTVGSAYERSESAAQKELIALYGHTPGLKEDIVRLYRDEKTFLRALYDFVEIYDLWFAGVK